MSEKQSDWVKKPIGNGDYIIYNKNATGIAVDYSDRDKMTKPTKSGLNEHLT